MTSRAGSTSDGEPGAREPARNRAELKSAPLAGADGVHVAAADAVGGTLAPLVEAVGPLAVVALVTTGSADSRSSAILEIGLVLVDGAGGEAPRLLSTPLRVRDGRPAAAAERIGLTTDDLASAPAIEDAAPHLRDALKGRRLVVHDEGAVRPFLAREISPALARAACLDTRDLVSLAHPDVRDSSFDALTLRVLERPARPRAGEAAVDLLAEQGRVAESAAARRYRVAARALRRFVPGSPWLALLSAPHSADDHDEPQFLAIGESDEPPVPFDADAIAAVLLDEARGRRHFPGYRARAEQVELMRGFHRNLAGGGTLLLEGGTGVGKSLAYLAAAIPFVMARAAEGERDPVVVSTRTKLLQDQLLENDIAAAARMLGHADLRALSIKGRANYVCEKRLQETLARGGDGELLEEDRLAFATLLGCARNRSAGEVGALPASLLSRHPLLRDLVRGSVAQRAEQCSREECAHRKRCPFGQRRAALAKAHLVVANHDLLLRWPPDYPRVGHVIADEGHELAGVADDVYSQVVRPEELMERIDEVFGVSPAANGAEPAAALLPRKQRLEAQKTVRDTRRELALDLGTIGRTVSARAGEYGEVELPEAADALFPAAAQAADAAAGRLESLARLADELDARAEWSFDEAPTAVGDGPTAVQRNASALRESAEALRTAFGADAAEVVAAFDRLVVPYDRWLLALRPVSPAGSFHRQFLEGRDSFAAVSASLFVGGDAFAALGELELEERTAFGVDRLSVASPFDYASNMRIAALPDPQGPDELVPRTAEAIALLARRLGGRTLGLFTSLRRMREVAERLEVELARDGIEVLWPQRAAADPAGLVRRFRGAPGGAVLLGARTFWQGVDIPGDDLQAVVIEKLPFEVPTELRRRREARIRDLGVNAFERYRLGKMLLHLKQMAGRLIRGESDRGIVVIVEPRGSRGYSRRLGDAFPAGTEVHWIGPGELVELATEVQLGAALTGCDSKS